ncbi:MAG: PD-(D/E)XK nuclease family protein [Thermoleophilia bacterium]
MPLKLICGPTGSGKTTRAIEAFLAAIDRGESAVFIAPSKPDKYHFLRRILASRPVLAGGKVATFNDLLEEFLEDEADPPSVVTSAERSILLRAVADGPGKPETLAESSNFEGFITELARLINELEEAGIRPEALGKALKKWAGSDAWRRGLNQDLFRLYDEYQGIMEDRNAEDSAQSGRRALGRLIEDSSLLGYQSIIVDGFKDFTPLQMELIAALREAAPELVVTLPYQEGKAALGTPAHYFELLKPGAEVEFLTESYEDDRAPAIRHIAENLFEEEAGRIAAGPAVTVLQAAGVRGQAELVAAEVLKLWRDEQTGLDDMAVVTHSHGPDSLAVASAFADFGIPFETSGSLPLVSTPVGRTAMAAIELAAGTGSLLAYLRSPLQVAEADRVDEFDRLSRSLNTDDPSILMLEWNRLDGRPLEEIERLKQAAALGIEPLASEMTDIMRSLVRAAATDSSLEKIEMDAAALRNLVSACKEAARAGEIIGEQPSRKGEAESFLPGARELLLLRDCIKEASWWPGSGSSRNCVRLLDPHRVLNQRFDAIFVCGLLEGQFPSMGRENVFLSDADREWLRDNAGLPLAANGRRLDEERFLYQRTLTRARRRIYLCYPYCDQKGEPTVRSLFVDDTLDLFEGDAADPHVEDSWETRSKQISDISFRAAEAPTATQALLSLASRNPGNIPQAARALGELEKAAADAGLAGRLQHSLEARMPNWPHIGDEVKKQLAGQEYFRVTELERYLRCPFGFFVERVVRPQPLERDDFALARGSAVHAILCRFLEELKPGKIYLPRADDGQIEQARRIMRHIVDEEMEQMGEGLRPEITRISLLSHLDRFIDRERTVRPEFLPYDCEMGFGICDKAEGGVSGRYDEDTMLQFGDIKLCGKIDRIDLRDGKTLAVVIDYKTSSDNNLTKQADFKATGTIQVPLYMLAAREIWGFEPIGGEYYGILGKRRRGVYLEKFRDILGLASGEPYENEFVAEGVFEACIETAKEQAISAAAGIRAGDFPCAPLEDESCKHCDYTDICRKKTLPKPTPDSEVA